MIIVVANTFFFICLAVTAIWLVCSLLLSYENHRYSTRKLRKVRPVRSREHRAMLVVPVKGADNDLETNLECFFNQQHPNYELVFVVESVGDPACGIIRYLITRHPRTSCRLVVAGPALISGQKVHNLLAATANIPDDVGILAFADADIAPSPVWLHTICYTVARSRTNTANTGYRLILPKRNTLANLLVYSINATVAGMMGAGKHFPVWGGSWAIRRSNFHKLGIRHAWRGTLCDDLVASRIVARSGNKVVFDPRCLSKTEFDVNIYGAIEFLRRQYVQGKFYSSGLFRASLALNGALMVAWWPLVWLACTAHGSVFIAAMIGLVAMYLTSLIRNVFRQHVLYCRDSTLFRHYKIAAAFDIFGWPIVATVNFAVMICAAFGRCIRWRGNHYRIYPTGQIKLLGTVDAPTQALPATADLKKNRAA